MVEVLWDIDPLDWCTSDVGTVVQRVVSKVDDNQIILMHDASQTSVNAALQIVDILQKQGYEFVTAEDIIFE
jgi:peptidoglycan/xylan/chitin deacetylase (PgdA/CDA1 family)